VLGEVGQVLEAQALGLLLGAIPHSAGLSHIHRHRRHHLFDCDCLRVSCNAERKSCIRHMRKRNKLHHNIVLYYQRNKASNP
jgi:hypothetical protein